MIIWKLLKRSISLRNVMVVWNGNLKLTYLSKIAALWKSSNPKQWTGRNWNYQLFTVLYLAQLELSVYSSHSGGCFESYLSTVCYPVLLKVILSFQDSRLFSSWQTWMCCFCLQFPFSFEQKLAPLACCTCFGRYVPSSCFAHSFLSVCMFK